MTSLRTALGMPVVATDTAEQLGTVSGVAIDPETGRIVSVHLGGSKASARFVPWDQISSFGSDAIMVEGPGAVRDVDGPIEDRVAQGNGDVLGKRTLTDAGDEMGEVGDIQFDPTDGRLQTLDYDAGSIGSDRLLGIGSYAVVVQTDDEHER